MSIDDDIFDIAEAVKNTTDKVVFDRLMGYINALERSEAELQLQNNELKSTIKVMMGIKQETS